jgi:hypothetical protein
VNLTVGMDIVQNRQISKRFGESHSKHGHCAGLISKMLDESHSKHGHCAEQTDLQEVW